MSKFVILFIVLSNWGEESVAITPQGTRARSGQFPWLIQFQTVAPCGGILISPDWVLTAAQCVQYKRNSITLYAAGLNGTGSGQTVGVKATYIFPEYRSYSAIPDHEHNIALLKLVEPFDMCDDKVQLLDTAPVRLDNNYKTCLIFGWQSYVAPSTKVLAKPIRYSPVLLNSWKLCMYMLKGNASYNNVFCTMIESDDNGVKACAGNPGSPVVCEDQYQRMILIGIASWSNFSLDCDGIPTYLGVSVFRSWMYDLIFNDRKNQEWDSDFESKSKGSCGRDRYLGNSLGNYSSLLDSEYREQANRRANEKTKTFQSDFREDKRPQESRPSGDNVYQINSYGGISSKYGIPTDIISELDDNLKQYHEVGRGKETLGRREDGINAFLAGRGESNNLGPSNTDEKINKGVSKDSKIDSDLLDDELNEFDFAIPLDDDYFMAGSYSIHFCRRKLSPFATIFLASLFACILMIF